MRMLNSDTFNQLIASVAIKPRLRQELRFTTSTAAMTADDWRDTELLAVTDRSGRRGVLLFAPGDDIFAVPYELSKGMTNRQTGRAQPIICDFCRTWQAGSGAARISFSKNKQTNDSVGFLCCADLQCSRHVRGQTVASRVARAQLREDLTSEQRVERLVQRLHEIVQVTGLQPLRAE